jgi:selenocysteine lyase/cysteine desulfurase
VNAVIARLAKRQIVTSGRHDGLRVSFHVYNTMDDVRAVLRALEENLHLMVREGADGNNDERARR